MILVGVIVIALTVIILAHEQPGINRACERLEK